MVAGATGAVPPRHLDQEESFAGRGRGLEVVDSLDRGVEGSVHVDGQIVPGALVVDGASDANDRDPARDRSRAG
jgi:hypothetical protein